MSTTIDHIIAVRPVERHAVMTWAQRLKRAFNIDMQAGVAGR